MMNIEKQKEQFKNHIATFTDYDNIKIMAIFFMLKKHNIYNYRYPERSLFPRIFFI